MNYLKQVIKDHLENLINTKNVFFKEDEYTIELELNGYITKYSYCNFIRETKHFFRNNAFSQENHQKYRKTEYKEWKERYDALRYQSFQILDFILTLESSLFSIILETCLADKLDEESKLIDKISKSRFVRNIDSRFIEQELKKRGHTDNFELSKYIKEYTYECISRLSYSETIDMLYFLYLNYEDSFNKVCSVLIKHEGYGEIFSLESKDKIIFEHNTVGEIKTWFIEKGISIDNLVNSELSRKLFFDKTPYYQKLVSAINRSLEETIMRHSSEDKVYFQEILYENIENKISKTKISKYVRSAPLFNENMKFLIENCKDQNSRELRRNDEFKANFNTILNASWIDFLRSNVDSNPASFFDVILKNKIMKVNISGVTEIFKGCNRVEIDELNCYIRNKLNFYNSQYIKVFKIYKISVDFRNSISHGKTYISPSLSRSDRSLSKMLLHIFCKKGIISEEEIKVVTDAQDYYSRKT